MKFSEIADLSKVELIKRINTAKNDYFQLKTKLSLGQLGNPLLVQSTRRDIARLMTALKKHEQVTNEKVKES